MLPNLIIIGAMKCGTTSLHQYLGLHPEIYMSREKELDFFIGERNWDRGVKWYKAKFSSSGKVHGETSPNYTAYPFFDSVPLRMHSVIPNAKLIYIVRDPIDRMISQYVHLYADGLEDRNIEAIFKNLDYRSGYIYRSKYFMQLEQYLDYFPTSNILVVTLEEFVINVEKTLQKVFGFLDVSKDFSSPKFSEIKHRSTSKRRKNRMGLLLKRASEMRAAKIFSTETRRKMGKTLYLPFSSKIDRPVLDEKLRNGIIEYLKDDINELRRFTGRDFSTWCV